MSKYIVYEWTDATSECYINVYYTCYHYLSNITLWYMFDKIFLSYFAIIIEILFCLNHDTKNDLILIFSNVILTFKLCYYYIYIVKKVLNNVQRFKWHALITWWHNAPGLCITLHSDGQGMKVIIKMRNLIMLMKSITNKHGSRWMW